MMKGNSGISNISNISNILIERVLELSADAHIEQRRTPKGSAAFHKLGGAIAAYGKALALLVAVQQREEFYAIIGERDLPEHFSARPL